jgi:FxsC-like protein
VREVEARDPAEAAPYFFLSYPYPPGDGSGAARQPDAWLVKLFDDLCDRVVRIGHLPQEAAKSVGFMDRGPWADGPGLPLRLRRALATSRVFVPLFSRRYFESEYCGRQWSTFTGRPLSGESRGRIAADAIIPVLWAPVDGDLLPPVARSVRLNHADLGECYAANGIYGIIKLTRYREAYEAAVGGLAQLIIGAAEASPVAPGRVTDDDSSLMSAFGPEAAPVAEGPPLRITVVAPRQGELPGEQGTLRGRDACGWNPYASETVRGLADHAADLARALGYRPQVGDIQQHRDELLSGGPPTSPEVLIVDARVTMIDGYARLLRRLDAMDKPWVQVVVPWKQDDDDSEAVRAKLWSALFSVLGHKLAGGRATSSVAVRGVRTLDDFSHVLPAVIMTAARHYLRHARAFPPAVGPEVKRSRLSLSLPDTSTTELPGA